VPLLDEPEEPRRDRHGLPRAAARGAHLGEEVAAHVRELIMTGAVESDTYLRPERIAAELGISITPVREGLLALRGEGFVRLVPRHGFLVSPLSRADVEDLYQAQGWLAGELAARAARHADTAALDDLERRQQSLESAARAGDSRRVEQENHEFHRGVNRAAQAPKLAWMLAVATRYAPRRFFPTIHGWVIASVEDHRPVLEALRAADPDAARSAMRRHIEHAGALLVAHLGAQPAALDSVDTTRANDVSPTAPPGGTPCRRVRP
jgi:DNA-binding GntR family transcriptional regulator